MEHDKKISLDCKQDWDRQVKLKALKQKLQQEILKIAASQDKNSASESAKDSIEKSKNIRKAAEELRVSLLHS